MIVRSTRSQYTLIPSEEAHTTTEIHGRLSTKKDKYSSKRYPPTCSVVIMSTDCNLFEELLTTATRNEATDVAAISRETIVPLLKQQQQQYTKKIYFELPFSMTIYDNL